MLSKKGLCLGITLAAAVLACNLSQGLEGTEEDPVGTQVSSTLQAITSVEPSTVPHTTGERSPTPEPLMEQRIVFTHQGDVWFIEGDQTPFQLTDAGGTEEVSISADGARIAFTRQASNQALIELWSVQPDGGEIKALISMEQFDQFYPSQEGTSGFVIGQMDFVPGSHTLLFNILEVIDETWYLKKDDLHSLDVDTGEMTQLFPAGEGGDFVLSPDGRYVLIIRPDGIDLAETSGGKVQANVITYEPVITYSEFRYYAQPVWAPDSRFASVAIPSPDPLADSPSGDLWRIPIDGSPATKTSTISGDFYFTQVFANPSLSPDLNRVAFLREATAGGPRDLYLANIDGSGETLYASGNLSWWGWSPDNVHFVYSHPDPMDLMLGADEGDPSDLVDGQSLEWLNGREFLYLAGEQGAWTLMKGEIGGASVVLSEVVGGFVSIDFTSAR